MFASILTTLALLPSLWAAPFETTADQAPPVADHLRRDARSKKKNSSSSGQSKRDTKNDKGKGDGGSKDKSDASRGTQGDQQPKQGAQQDGKQPEQRPAGQERQTGHQGAEATPHGAGPTNAPPADANRASPINPGQQPDTDRAQPGNTGPQPDAARAPSGNAGGGKTGSSADRAPTNVRPNSSSKADNSRITVRASVAIHTRPSVGPKVVGSHVHFDIGKPRAKPLSRTRDHRFARPVAHHLRHHRHAAKPPPRFAPYRHHYARWWVHPWFRFQHATVRIVLFPFTVSPWAHTWVPASRPGFVWVPGRYNGPFWVPGHWAPTAAAPVVRSTSYIYVPGYWQEELYVEGYYRSETRSDGDWGWVEGAYLDDGTFIPGHWRPTGLPPAGMTWEPGFFDGENWVEGFWRPENRFGHRWVSAYYDGDGVYHNGYWEPTMDQPGAVWIPGWFDGNAWIEGYWVSEQEYANLDLGNWEAEEGYDAGWEEEGTTSMTANDEIPLALPVTFGADN